MTIQLLHHEFVSALVEIRRIDDELRQHRSRAEHSVDVLLDGGWSGRAAGSYLEGWERWRSGCDEILDALAHLADLLEQARRDLIGTDGQVAEAFA